MIKNRFAILAGILIPVGITYGTVVYLNSQRVGAPQFGPEPATSPYLFWLRLAGLIIVTFVGIVSSYLFEQVRSVSGSVNIRLLLRSMWTSPRFIMALIVSPLVFNAIYLVIGDLPRSIATTISPSRTGLDGNASSTD